MAAKTLRNGTTTLPVAWETPDRSARYSVRTDGIILYQWRDSSGLLHGATKSSTRFKATAIANPDFDLAAAFKVWANRHKAIVEVRK